MCFVAYPRYFYWGHCPYCGGWMGYPPAPPVVRPARPVVPHWQAVGQGIAQARAALGMK